MLSGTLQLHDVADAERFARKALNDGLRYQRAHLHPADYEDALAFIVAEAWELSRRYDPTKGVSFSKYAYGILIRRVVSWYRQRGHGDSRYGQGAIPTSLTDSDRDMDTAAFDDAGDLLSTINTALLTPQSRMTFERVLRPHVEEDLTLEQVGARLGWGRRRVAELLDVLRTELEAKCLAA